MYTGNIASDLWVNSMWMGWNIFLAVIPFLLAKHLFNPKQRISAIWSILFVVFALFLPNAPYVITDIIHLYRAALVANSTNYLILISLQFVLLMLAGFWLFAESYRSFEKFILKKHLYRHRYVMRLATFVTVSFGVFIGRFLRFNSWDAFMDPRGVFYTLRHINDLPAIFFVGGFSLLLFFTYSLYERVTIKLR